MDLKSSKLIGSWKKNLGFFYNEISSQPVKFTTCGFYTINYELLAGVKIKITYIILYFDYFFFADSYWDFFISNNFISTKLEKLKNAKFSLLFRRCFEVFQKYSEKLQFALTLKASNEL